MDSQLHSTIKAMILSKQCLEDFSRYFLLSLSLLIITYQNPETKAHFSSPFITLTFQQPPSKKYDGQLISSTSRLNILWLSVVVLSVDDMVITLTVGASSYGHVVVKSLEVTLMGLD